LHCLIYKVHSLPGLPRSVPRLASLTRACLIYHPDAAFVNAFFSSFSGISVVICRLVCIMI